jgi:hypothetical protein
LQCHTACLALNVRSLRGGHLLDERGDGPCQVAIRLAARHGQCAAHMHPGFDGFCPRGLGLCAALGAGAMGAKATILARLQAPQGVEVPAAPPRCLPSGLSLDAVPTKLLGKSLAPPVQIGLARVEALAML